MDSRAQGSRTLAYTAPHAGTQALGLVGNGWVHSSGQFRLPLLPCLAATARDCEAAVCYQPSLLLYSPPLSLSLSLGSILGKKQH